MILIVDDDRCIRTSLRLLLERSGYEVAEAKNKQEAMNIVWNQPPELILMDMNFSPLTTGEEGLQLLRQVKSDGFQIVLVTGSGQKTLLNRLDRNYFGIFHNDLEITSYDVHNGKPSPEPYLRGLQKAAVKPWEALVVENAPLGVQAGVAAQIFTIAVNTGPLSDKVLHDAGADLLLPSMTVLSEQWPVIRDSLA
jgi:beta-phosphoglucomutase-like phosphatase (HAD superfamily)